MTKTKDGMRDSGQNNLIEQNIALVIALAKQYAKPTEPLDDYIQDGCIGLMKAAEHFDASKGYAFSTYATWWVKRYLQISQHKQHFPMKISEDDVAMARKIIKAKEQGEQNTGAIAALVKSTPKKIREVRDALQPVLSLDYAKDGDSEMVELLESTLPRAIHIGNMAATMRVDMLMSALDDREKRIIIAAYGLFGYPKQQAADIAKQEKLTVERIRQIEAKALKKMRNASIEN